MAARGVWTCRAVSLWRSALARHCGRRSLLGDYSTPFGTVLGQTVGNTLALVIAALVLRRLTGGRGELERVFDVLALVACAFLAAIISAAFGPMSLYLGDVIAADDLGASFAHGRWETRPASWSWRPPS